MGRFGATEAPPSLPRQHREGGLVGDLSWLYVELHDVLSWLDKTNES